MTPDALFRAPAQKLSDAVALTGQSRDETIDRLKATAEAFRRHREALDFEATRGLGLLTVWRRLGVLMHIDPRQRRRALLFALGVPVLPVDEDISRVVLRVTQPLGVPAAVRGAPPAAAHARARILARRWLIGQLPPDLESYRDAVVYVRHHAHHTCLPVGPHCLVCPLASGCATGGTDGGAIH